MSFSSFSGGSFEVPLFGIIKNEGDGAPDLPEGDDLVTVGRCAGRFPAGNPFPEEGSLRRGKPLVGVSLGPGTAAIEPHEVGRGVKKPPHVGEAVTVSRMAFT